MATATIIITNAAAPEVDTDAVAKLLALFDYTLDRHRALAAMAASVPGARRSSGALIDLIPTVENERALMTWARSHDFAVRDETFNYEPRDGYPHGYTIRAIRVYAGDLYNDELVHMGFNAVAKEASRDE